MPNYKLSENVYFENVHSVVQLIVISKTDFTLTF
jgi:hypothetical protein